MSDTKSYHAGRHFLQIPGPSNVPDRVLRAIAQPTIDHRGKVSTTLGKVVSGVADRATHNRKNMEVTLQNLAKACA